MRLQPESSLRSHRRAVLTILCPLILSTAALAQPADPPRTALETLQEEAAALAPLAESKLTRHFLEATADLPPFIGARTVYFRRATNEAFTPAEAERTGVNITEESGFLPVKVNERLFYYTRYGTPLAAMRMLDLAAASGVDRVDGARIADFGCGTIGHLRLLASLGAEVIGLEVDPLLRAMYSEPEDMGRVQRATVLGTLERHHTGVFFWGVASRCELDSAGVL